MMGSKVDLSVWTECKCDEPGECGHEPHGTDGLCERCDHIAGVAKIWKCDFEVAEAMLTGVQKLDSIDETHQTLNEPWDSELANVESVPWYVVENDLIGGYSIATAPGTLSEVLRTGGGTAAPRGQMIADFTNSNYAHEIVRLHNREGRDVATDEATGVPHGVGYWHLRARLAEKKVQALEVAMKVLNA